MQDLHFFQKCCHFQYNISWHIKTKSADVILKMTTILKEMRIAQLWSKSERTLVNDKSSIFVAFLKNLNFYILHSRQNFLDKKKKVVLPRNWLLYCANLIAKLLSNLFFYFSFIKKKKMWLTHSQYWKELSWKNLLHDSFFLLLSEN